MIYVVLAVCVSVLAFLISVWWMSGKSDKPPVASALQLELMPERQKYLADSTHEDTEGFLWVRIEGTRVQDGIVATNMTLSLQLTQETFRIRDVYGLDVDPTKVHVSERELRVVIPLVKEGKAIVDAILHLEFPVQDPGFLHLYRCTLEFDDPTSGQTTRMERDEEINWVMDTLNVHHSFIPDIQKRVDKELAKAGRKRSATGAWLLAGAHAQM